MMANLALITYNIVKFLIPLKVKSWQLIAYYVLATIMMFARIVDNLIYSLHYLKADRWCSYKSALTGTG